jgi:pimeloyl-ACP methyl ester carboxylesterase
MERREATDPQVAPLWGELRYGAELMRLLAGHALRPLPAAKDPQPVLLVPGFMAGDASLAVLRLWLERRGHPVSVSGIRISVDCTERIVSRLEQQLEELASKSGRRVFLIGQSRGGAMARCLAVRNPAATNGVVMLGTPVCDPLAICPPVQRTLSMIAHLGDLGVPRLLSTSCRDGDCCEAIWDEISAPLAPHIYAVSVYSRSDGIVDWRACVDPHAESVEVDSSHCGMSVHPRVYELLARVLDGAPARTPAARGKAGRRAASARARTPRAPAPAFS